MLKMLNIQKAVLTIVLTLATPGLVLAAGSGNHSHTAPAQPRTTTCTPEHEAMGHCKMSDSTPPASTCTPEHEAMGHCKMEENDVHAHAHTASTVGQPAPAGTAPARTITVHLVDSMRFNFSAPPTAKAGEVIRFVVMNKGKVPHEFGIGSVEEQKSHREMMKAMPDMKHEDGQVVTVAPGETRELLWQFAGSGTTAQYACSIPGHFEAGMHHEITIQ
ncbi:MAG: cupredoxin family protein [Thiothrix sp.]|nr:cupredoxin family protein [Thiothrix sp.]HPE60759.1 cupredoxin family protein [Thiolinea sp.]